MPVQVGSRAAADEARDVQGPELTISDEDDFEGNITLADRLRDNFFIHQDGKEFLPTGVLANIMTREEIAKKLGEHDIGGHRTEWVVRTICGEGEGDTPATHDRNTYYIVFALLILLDLAFDILSLVELGVSDQQLPLSCLGGQKMLCFRETPEKPLACFRNWKYSDRDYFEQWQYRLLVPFFEPKIHTNGHLEMAPQHYRLPDRIVLPWCAGKKAEEPRSRPDNNKSVAMMISETRKMASENLGAEARVTCVKIADGCHGFQEMLGRAKLSGPLFALKTLNKSKDEANFQRELEQLKRFNGLGHAHLVTLLATFEYRGTYNFLFPYSEGNLEDYWRKQVPRPTDIGFARWVAGQLAGLVDALDYIHNPTQHPTKFGRHGDLKPDNILWYKREGDPLGNLVIADYGLSALNNDATKSNIPNRAVHHNPDYRPPECEIEGGTISRAYDVWTLGCVFMEMLMWFLGGQSYLAEFGEARYTPEIDSWVDTKLFYEIQKYEYPESEETAKAVGAVERRVDRGRILYTISIKPIVMKWFDKIHGHPACSQFIHEVAEIIENKMLVVLSEGRRRGQSMELKTDFAGILGECNANAEYCVKATPIKKPSRSRSSAMVEAILNKSTQAAVERNRPSLRISTGPVLAAPKREDLIDIR